jgi:hypothetical protein
VAARLTSLFPRIVALTAILVLASATISFAASTHGGQPAPTGVAVAVPELVTVPDVRGQAYVFAKGTLEEAGFAWRVVGGVQGYPANTVASQVPAAGTRVIDTGMPTISLGLARNTRYAEEGMPDNGSPYRGTEIRRPAKPKPVAKPQPAPKPKPKPVVKPKPRPVAKPKPVARPKPKPRPVVKPKPVKPPVARPRDFVVAGAPAEPLDEITLPARAKRLERWLRSHPNPTNANVRHWLYQHEWIVTGARFGWWHGAEALEILIRADGQVQKRWGIGKRSEAAARRALAAVRAQAR